MVTCPSPGPDDLCADKLFVGIDEAAKDSKLSKEHGVLNLLNRRLNMIELLTAKDAPSTSEEDKIRILAYVKQLDHDSPGCRSVLDTSLCSCWRSF